MLQNEQSLTSDANSSSEKVFVFLDESIKPAHSILTYVAAVVVHNPAVAEHKISELFEGLAAEPHRWTRDSDGSGNERFTDFLKEGFHYTTNDLTIQKDFIDLICTLEYSAHVGYSANPHNLGEVDLLVTLFSQILSSVLMHYRENHVVLIFEQKEEMDDLYKPLVDAIAAEVLKGRGVRVSYTVLLGAKEDPCVAIADYVMGVAAAGLASNAQHFHQVRYADVSHNLAQLFDLDIAKNARRGRLFL